MNWKQKKKQLRIASTIFAIMFIVLFAFVSCGRSEKQNVIVNEREEQQIEYVGIEEYKVQAFDTLSSIAVKYIPSDKYMSQWIEDVKSLNGRKNSTIYFDEVIKVYVYEK